MAGRTEEAHTFTQPVTFLNTVQFVAASVATAAIGDSGGDLPANKVTQQRVFHYAWPGNPTTGKYLLPKFNSTATLKYVRATCDDMPSSGTLTIDLQKSASAAAFATVLGTTITFTSADTDRVWESGVFSDTAGTSNDSLAFVVTAGTGAAGVVAEVCWEESAYA